MNELNSTPEDAAKWHAPTPEKPKETGAKPQLQNEPLIYTGDPEPVNTEIRRQEFEKAQNKAKEIIEKLKAHGPSNTTIAIFLFRTIDEKVQKDFENQTNDEIPVEIGDIKINDLERTLKGEAARTQLEGGTKISLRGSETCVYPAEGRVMSFVVA